MTNRQQLVQLLREIGPENIWRPVYDRHGQLLADGHEDMRDGSPADLASFDFQDRSVLDMGCNLGFYSFLVRRAGAIRVTGIDSDSQAIRAATMLAELYDLNSTRFICTDFADLSNNAGFKNKKFDVVLLINFIGKKSLVKGIQPILDICRSYAEQAIIISARCRYHIRRSLRVEPEYIQQKYGSRYVQDEWFDTEFFISDYLGAELSRLSPDYEDTTLKRTFLLQFPFHSNDDFAQEPAPGDNTQGRSASLNTG